MAINVKDKLVTVEALAEVYDALTTVLNRIGASNLNSNPSMLVNLESTSAANVMQTSPRPGITGTLPISHGGTNATTAADARTNLGITPDNIGAAAVGYIAAKLYSVRGEIINSGTIGTTVGYGKATVAITGKTAIITYIAKIITAGTVSDVYDVGLSVATLRGINPDIPAITPLNGGNIQYYTEDGELDTRMIGYGGECTVNTTANRWNFARLYTTSGDIGTWSDSTYTTDKIVMGILYGKVS